MFEPLKWLNFYWVFGFKKYNIARKQLDDVIADLHWGQQQAVPSTETAASIRGILQEAGVPNANSIDTQRIVESWSRMENTAGNDAGKIKLQRHHRRKIVTKRVKLTGMRKTMTQNHLPCKLKTRMLQYKKKEMRSRRMGKLLV